MNQLSKTETKDKTFKSAFKSIANFIFSNAIGISGLIMLFCFAYTDLLVYLKIASVLSMVVVGLIFILCAQALFRLGFDSFFVEVEARFLDLTLYSTFLLGTLTFLIVEIFK